MPAQRRQLTAIAKQAQHLLAKLAALDAAPEAEFQLMHAYAAGLILPDDSSASPSPRRFESDRAHLLRLAENADKASEAMSIKRGAKSRRSVNLLVAALCHVFEAETKRPVTHTRAADGAPSSPAGRFIVAAVKAIDNAVTATQISTALAQFMASRDSASIRGQANN